MSDGCYRLLYRLSYLLTAPFWALGWVLYGMAVAVEYVGDSIHGVTTYRLWLVLHYRKCVQARKEGA